ncbi:MAG: C39 family peptidase [Nocardioidaceae bacterium]
MARWTSPVVTPGFAFTELVASWNTVTPPGSWVEVSAVVVCDDGRRSAPYILGRWAMDGETITRTSVPAQGDELASVVVDVLIASGKRRLVGWQLTVALHRLQGTELTPEVDLVAAMVSALPDRRPALPVRSPAIGSGVVLDVPSFSQELHVGRYPHLTGGGESWCSPAAKAMVVAYFGARPAAADYSWVDPSYDDPRVVHAAAHVFDAGYGAGNWPFGCAYAGELGLRAFVTRLRSLDEAETLVAAGVPVVASVSFADDELTGAGYATEGHLVVIVGFTDAGDVIVYVIRPPDVALPPPPTQVNW